MSDPVIEAYKKDVDRTLLRENLKLTPAERFLKFDRFMQSVIELREAGEQHRREQRLAERASTNALVPTPEPQPQAELPTRSLER
ncbi:MAG: hypothetical protein ABI557_18550 [Aureliella sp.]